jgi:hypothetical protein
MKRNLEACLQNAKGVRSVEMLPGWNERLVDRVALRPRLPAPQAPRAWHDWGTRKIPSPDVAFGDGIGRSATNATAIFTFVKIEA